MLPIIETRYAAIQGFPGYAVGSDGTVWTFWKSRGGAVKGMEIGSSPRKLSMQIRGGNKYLCVNLCENGRSKKFPVHILVLQAFVGPRPDGMVSRHGQCGRFCNRAENLTWGTQKQNIGDKHRDGTRVFGIRHHAAKMTPELVAAARKDFREGRTTILGASKQYGLSSSTMGAILKRRTWREVE